MTLLLLRIVEGIERDTFTQSFLPFLINEAEYECNIKKQKGGSGDRNANDYKQRHIATTIDDLGDDLLQVVWRTLI